jgi:uncharacterized membrane protein
LEAAGAAAVQFEDQQMPKRSFWWGLLWVSLCFLIGLVFVVLTVGIGLLVVWIPFGIVGLWFIYRIVKGWRALSNRQMMYR